MGAGFLVSLPLSRLILRPSTARWCLAGSMQMAILACGSRKDSMARRQALAMSDQFWGASGWGGRGYYAGSFFTRPFGGPFAQSPPVPPRPVGQRRPYQ